MFQSVVLSFVLFLFSTDDFAKQWLIGYLSIYGNYGLLWTIGLWNHSATLFCFLIRQVSTPSLRREMWRESITPLAVYLEVARFERWPVVAYTSVQCLYKLSRDVASGQSESRLFLDFELKDSSDDSIMTNNTNCGLRWGVWTARFKVLRRWWWNTWRVEAGHLRPRGVIQSLLRSFSC